MSSTRNRRPTLDIWQHGRMQGGPQDATGGRLPGPPDGAEPVETVPEPDLSTDGSAPGHEHPSPQLPRSEATPSISPTLEPVQPTRGTGTWYRSDQDRFRSVHNLANPWYRRVTRIVIGMAFLAVAGVGLFVGAQLVRDFLDRERLPSEGADLPAIRATTFEIRSTTPAPVLDGTLTLDALTRAFEYVGRGTGSQAGTQVVSPDGSAVYVRRGENAWSTDTTGDATVADVLQAVDYLADDDSADDVLTRQLRRGYVDLIDRTEVGEADDELRRYELRLDTASLQDNFPLEFQAFGDEAIPGVQSVRGLLVTITLDRKDVLVGVDDSSTNWSWQRLAYSDQEFRPPDPSADLLNESIDITDGSVDDG